MTREEAEDVIRGTEGRLCVRFYRRRDGTILTQNCPTGLRALRRRLSRLSAAVVTALPTFFANICLLWWVDRDRIEAGVCSVFIADKDLAQSMESREVMGDMVMPNWMIA